jgi:hypothetical protein
VLNEYIVPPRLAGADGQYMQGDVFRDVPFLNMCADGSPTVESEWGLLLTPTCDFALKDDHPERHLIPVEPVGPVSEDREATSPRLPLHLLPLSPLSQHLPHGAVVNFRRAQQVPAQRLQLATRVATLNHGALRQCLAAHTTYYTRSSVDPSAIDVPADDPRLLWQAIDSAHAIPGLAAKRSTLDGVLAVAIRALARHHGVHAPSDAAALVWLEVLTKQKLLPPSSRKAVRGLSRAQKTLLALYKVTPKDLGQKDAEYRLLFQELERVGTILQERSPRQVTAEDLRSRGLANLLRA